MIHSVSFGDLAAEMAKPPLNSNSQTSAASGMRHRRASNESSATKTIVTTAVGVAVAAAILAALRGKVSTFKDIDLTKGIKAQEGIMAKVKYGVAKSGQVVIDGFNRVKSWIPFLNKKAEKAVEGAE